MEQTYKLKRKNIEFGTRQTSNRSNNWSAVALHVLSRLTLTGTVISLVVVTPLLVLFSPVLISPSWDSSIPNHSWVLILRWNGVDALSALTWICNCVSGKHPVGSDKVDHARMRDHYVLNKAHEVAQQATS
ncbi:hypothetical protein MKX03_008061 [Papaver bracteatum]|nr:hypothetical protein MKX03_008061 [Papaver bracteatum]